MSAPMVHFLYRYAPDYDAEYRSLTADIDWSLDLCRRYARHGQVLEMACGTGRITIPIGRLAVSLGFSVTGVDLTPAMLQRARAKLRSEDLMVQSAVRLFEGDMCNVDVGEGAYSLALIPFHSFAHLLDTDSQLGALANIRRHLTPDGYFIADLFLPDVNKLANLSGQLVRVDERVEVIDDVTMVRSYSRTYEASRQLLHLTYYYDFYDLDGRLIADRSYRSSTTMRMIFPAEWELLLHSAGFLIEQRWADYAGTPFGTLSSGKMLFLCRRG